MHHTLEYMVGLPKMTVISVEYPGYSIYPGEPSEQSVIDDAVYVYDFLTQVIGVDPAAIYTAGRSLGTFFATSLAARRPVVCTALISPFTSLKVDITFHSERHSKSRVLGETWVTVDQRKLQYYGKPAQDEMPAVPLAWWQR